MAATDVTDMQEKGRQNVKVCQKYIHKIQESEQVVNKYRSTS